MLGQLRSAPNQLTLLRLLFVPFIATMVVDNRFQWAFWLLILAGVSDAFDGWLARKLNQRTQLGQYLDPIADKLLLGTMFLVLSSTGRIPWKITIFVFSRDVCILLICGVLYVTTSLRDFRPSILGKLNTVAQVFTVLLVVLDEFTTPEWIGVARHVGYWTVFSLTVLSAVHYVILVGQRLMTADEKSVAAS
jgi:cardiolipin synthase